MTGLDLIKLVLKVLAADAAIEHVTNYRLWYFQWTSLEGIIV
jgi:hypothetical protein